MTSSTYFDLLKNREYFETFLKHHNSQYSGRTASKGGTKVTVEIPEGMTQEKFMKIINRFVARSPRKSREEKEHHYGKLIKRYYGLGEDTRLPVKALIGNEEHLQDAYESLKEFGMGRRGAKLVPYKEFLDSVQAHSQVVVSLTNYRMDCIAHNAIPQSILDDLKVLFLGLKVVPQKQKVGKPDEEGSKLVAVSKTLHFLLPDLIMPIDSKVLRFIGKGEIPSKLEKQLEWFEDVFNKYIELMAMLGLKQSNGDGNWWNMSVPKRIDNAIMGFWDLFNDENIERIICSHIDMLLEYLQVGNQSV